MIKWFKNRAQQM